MTKMAATLIYGKSFKNLLFQNQVCSRDDPKLISTYLTSRSSCFIMHLNGKVLKIDYKKTVEAKVIILIIDMFNQMRQ